MFLIRLLLLWLVACLIAGQSVAQSPKKMTGEYYLSGVREVGSGIKLNDDATFEFFFSYGAVDRMGQGTWKQQGNQITLSSRPRPEKDFALVISRIVPGNKLTIRIVDPNKQILRYVECAVKNGSTIQREMTNSEGEVQFEQKSGEAISLRFELCPDRYSVFPITNKAHNYFEFRFEPWIAEAFFENVTYTLSETGFEGPHPLLEPGKIYSFERP
ncbi:hypothetical protein GO755_25160 [Spirosoma sp. HMF4905]|uniref:Uncharacterized protein n=1 Tax=Spirosoma arboris TaxID=2682092 RepID=A0A7K1SI22_9BACT|nr:hypothetical protein [Spirosoma arboris]MVM33354.1 hypothetical protein [Spirosoma arboris]